MELSATQRRVFLANTAFLRKTCPELHARVGDAVPGLYSGGSSPGGLALETARDGKLTLRKGGVYLESRFEPERNALALLRDASGSGPGTVSGAGAGAEGAVVFLGCGLGYHINAMIRREAGRYILVERETSVFCAALSVLEPDVFASLLPLVGMEEDEVLRRLEGFAHGRLALIMHPRSIRLHTRYYAGIESGILSRLKGALASSVTERANRRLWVKNIIRNVHALRGRCLGTSGFAKAFSGPVTLVASGPRLEDAVGSLKGLRGRIPLVALLPSYPFLHAEGIEPDLLVTTDAGFWNRFRLARGVRIPLLSTWSAEPALLRGWDGELALFSHGLPLEEGLRGLRERSLVVPMQGTASAVMILLARAMGFGEIFLAGFDFAFRGMEDHHRGAGFDRVLLASSNRFRSWHTQAAARFRLEPFVRVTGQSGERVHTSRKLLLYRDWIEKELAGDDLVRVTGGAAIRGVRALFGEPAREFGSSAVKRPDTGGMQAFGAALRGLIEGGVSPGALEEEMEGMRGRLSGREDLRSVYRVFFGEPRAGVPVSEIEQDAQWALGEIGRRWKGPWDR